MRQGMIILLLMFGLLSVAATARTATPTKNETAKPGISLDFESIELADLVKTISELTGRNFVYDDTLKGAATIISPDPMTFDEAYNLFLTVLNVKGFTVVPSGKVFKIVKIREATESNLPLLHGNLQRAGEQYVTRTVRLRYAEAAALADTILKPLIPKTSHIAAYAPTNTLLISDSAANINRLMKIIAEIDTRGTLDQLEIIPLQYANVDDIAELCNQVLTRSESGTAQNRQRQTTDTRAISKVMPYSRTNSLVVMAGDEDLQLLRPLIERLDRQPSQNRAHINVYYLENADAETLAKTLSEIVSQSSAGAAKKGAPLGTALTDRGITISADKPTNALIINATPEDFELIKDIIGQLDIKRKQVFVEALIMELSMGATKSLGASLQGAIATGSDSAIYLSTNLNGGSTTLSDFSATSTKDDDNGMANILGKAVNGILLGGFFSPISVAGADGSSISVPALSALIQLSQSDTDINILSAPRLLTSDNEEAEIVVGSNVPIITGRLTNTTSSDSLAQSVTVERKDVALTLRFTPQITEGDLVRLNIYQEITDLASTQIGDVDQVGPTLTKRLLRNTVLVENGRTVVLGGLIGDKTDETVTKVPGLGDIPLIGWLFKQKSTTRQKTNLMIFITPHILKDAKDLAQVTHRNRQNMEAFRPEGKQLLILPSMGEHFKLDGDAPDDERRP